MTGSASSRSKPLKIGDIEVANRVLLAPMSGVTDAPFRRLAAALGAGLVVSEMTASDDLVNGRPMSRLRCEATGIGPHVVQIAGCEAGWMAEGARIAEAAGAEIIDINMGCPARHVTGGQSGSALMRRRDGMLDSSHDSRAHETHREINDRDHKVGVHAVKGIRDDDRRVPQKFVHRDEGGICR